jgi:LmbE family N-acetylglucosaminyl deacetylase
MKKKILVFSAHPDDETLGCGGYIKKLTKFHEASICIFSTGITSRKKFESKSIDKLKKSALKVFKLLGFKKNFFLNLDDNKLDKYPLLEIIKKIEIIINNEKPNVIFTHFPYDLNIDHEIVTRAVITACRPIEKNKKFLKKILFYETLSSTEWSYKEKFRPNLYIDITNTIKYKIRSLKLYKSEIRNFPHPRSAMGVEVLAKKRGSEIGMKYAESFMIYRELEN